MRCVVAVMDAGDVLGREVVQVLDDDEAAFVSELRLFGGGEDTTGHFRGRALPIRPYSPAAFKGVHIAINGGDREIASGAVAVALATEHSDALLVVPGLDLSALEDHEGLVTIPDGVSMALALLARAFQGELERITGAVLLPASACGPKGIEELYAQTVALFNQDPLPDDVLGGRLAFNVRPTDYRFLGLDRLGLPSVSLTTLLVPVFAGTTLVLDLWLRAPMGASAAAARIEAVPGLDLGDSAEPADLVGQPFVRVVRPEGGDRLRVLAALDDVRITAASLVQVAREIADREAM